MNRHIFDTLFLTLYSIIPPPLSHLRERAGGEGSKLLMKYIPFIAAALILSCSTGEKPEPAAPAIHRAQGEMAGEVTQTSVILQSRLTLSEGLVDGDVPGSPGAACFEISTDAGFLHYLRTGWVEARPENDYIVKVKVEGLRPGVRYYYRIAYGAVPDGDAAMRGEANTFRTLPDSTDTGETSFVVVTGMNYSFFHHGRPGQPGTAYNGADKALGYPALATIAAMNPDFFVGTGDNVYYDHPVDTRAKTVPEMRRKWHEQFVQPRFRELFSQVPAYWQKDDHDYRYNDADTTDIPDKSKPTDTALPTHEEGVGIFREQVPVVDPFGTGDETYRTHRINALLQIWILEGRDFRSPNSAPDSPDKTLWGAAQKEWLQRTLLDSDAVFKLIISPTPMVGPDDAYKSDNHVNHNGFRREGEEFFAWLGKNGFITKNLYIICGDRHWQYHAAHPSGFEEYSCGALVDANSRLGRKPGDPESTDPGALITQFYTQEEASGGFLRVSVRLGANGGAPEAEFAFFDEKGVHLYSTVKAARM